MQKFTGLDALDQPRRRTSKAPVVLLFLLILIATPPLFEVGKMNLAQWGLLGFAGRVETPVLDFASAHWEAWHGEFRDWSTPFFVNRRWKPEMVIPFAFVWTALAALMLRRGH